MDEFLTETEERPNYYAVIPAHVRYSNITPNAKLLFGEIAALSNKTGYCFATNDYFAKLYNVSKITVSRLINELVEHNFIVSKIVKGGINKNVNRYIQICIHPLNKNVKENNTSINNTFNNYNPLLKDNYYKSYSSDFLQKSHSQEIFNNTSKGFKKPTIEEIELYCKENNKNVDAISFYNFYESKDWMIGKNKMKKWKAAIATWDRKNKLSKPSEPHESIYSNEIED